MTTEEEAAAQAKLDAAVVEYVLAMGYSGFCDSYILVSHQHVMDAEGGTGRSQYAVGLMGASQADHICLGLLDVGKDIIRGVARQGREQ